MAKKVRKNPSLKKPAQIRTSVKPRKRKMATKIPRAITTPNSVKTRIGTLSFEKGYPSEKTTRKLFDEIDYQRAV